jgi:hypothetical protein
MIDDNNAEPTDTHVCSVLEELTRTIESGGAAERLRILRRVTDLFMAGAHTYSDSQIAVFDDILQQLVAELEAAVRARMSRKMADLSRAPRKLVRSFAFDDDIQVAAPVLMRSRALSEDDLVENASSKSQAHLLAIAQRIELSENVTDVLVERGDINVVRKMARNRRARFSLPGYDKLIVRARRDRKLTLTIGQRRDLPRHCFLKLLENASASVRAQLEAAHPQFVAKIQISIEEVAAEMRQEARALSKQHALAARKVQSRLRGREARDADVHAPAHAQDFDKAALSLAKFGDFSLDLVERALLDPGVDMVLVLAKAAGCSWTTVRALLQMRDAGRHLDADGLHRCAEQYKKLKLETARSIVRLREQRIRTHAEQPEIPSLERKGGDAAVVRMAC